MSSGSQIWEISRKKVTSSNKNGTGKSMDRVNYARAQEGKSGARKAAGHGKVRGTREEVRHRKEI